MAWPKHWTIGNAKWYFHENDESLENEIEHAVEAPMDTRYAESVDGEFPMETQFPENPLDLNTPEHPMSFEKNSAPSPWDTSEFEPMESNSTPAFLTSVEPSMFQDEQCEEMDQHTLHELQNLVEDLNAFGNTEFQETLKTLGSIMEATSSKQVDEAKPCSPTFNIQEPLDFTEDVTRSSKTDNSDSSVEIIAEIKNSKAPRAPPAPMRRSTRTCVIAKKMGFYKQIDGKSIDIYATSTSTSQCSTLTNSSGRASTLSTGTEQTETETEEIGDTYSTASTEVSVEESEAEDQNQSTDDDSFDFGAPCCRPSLKLKINVRKVFLEMVAADLKKLSPEQKSKFSRADLIQLGKRTAAYMFMYYDGISADWIKSLETYYGITEKDFPAIRQF